MPTSRLAPEVALCVLLLLCPGCVLARKPASKRVWKTLDGNEPAVIARGGFSGLLPDSSEYAYSFALTTSVPDVILWCDVKLTKDGVGVCLPYLTMDNGTDIKNVYPNGEKAYGVNGVPVSGYFPVDFTLDQLNKVSLVQSIFTRTSNFDSLLPILSVEDLEAMKPPGLWLNIQHDMFYSQHNLSMKSYVSSLSRDIAIDYISSPEVAFLSSIVRQSKAVKAKLVFRFLSEDMFEPSTNQTYGSLLKNLTFVKMFASGILVPKSYIWPVTADLYLKPYNSVVLDAHKMGLEVFASDFANDAPFAYNYSYNPVAEYLSFVDNGDFSVDGVLSDFPITASAAINCFSQLNKNSSVSGKPIIISHNGASGVFPGSTDLAYKQAIDDGADVIDCSVQVTSDGVLICFGSANLIEGTTVTTSLFGTRSSEIPEIQSGTGIFSFNLTWKEIQDLKPMIIEPIESEYRFMRNPASKNSGKFVTLTDFLALAKANKLSGVLINIEHAAFLAERLGFSVTDSVLKVLGDSGYNNQTSQEVMIQSSNSSVLVAFKKHPDYKLIYNVDEVIGDIDPSSINDIKRIADSVAIKKESIFPKNQGFVTSQTDLVQKLQSANLTVYVHTFMNEFVSQPWDFFSDPIVEINNYIQGASVDGLITDFPATSSSYRKNTCLGGSKTPPYMLPVLPGGLLSIMSGPAKPPAMPPFPPLTESDVLEPPLPSASTKMPLNNVAGQSPAPRASTSGGELCTSSASILILWAMLFLPFVIFR